MSGVVAFAWVALWLYLLACGLWVTCELLIPRLGRRLAERRWTR